MKMNMKIEDNGEVTITAEGKEYRVSETAALAISIMVPRYAENIIHMIMPIYKVFGIEAARTQLAEMRKHAIEIAPEAYEQAKSMCEGDGEPMITQLAYGEALINIAYDCVLSTMEKHNAEKAQHESHGEEFPNRQDMN